MFYHPANAFAEWRGAGDGEGFYRRQPFRGQDPAFLEAFMDLASAAENVRHGEDN
jgi:hypothetical protein